MYINYSLMLNNCTVNDISSCDLDFSLVVLDGTTVVKKAIEVRMA